MSPTVRTALLLALLPLAGCGPARYAGTMATQQGACGTGFDAAGHAPATLVVQGNDVQFAPSDGVTVLAGQMTEAGHITASSVAPGADHKPFQQAFEGDRDAGGDHVAGRFATPRCRATVTLTRR